MKNNSTLLITVLLLFLQSCSSLRIPTIYDGERNGVKELNLIASNKSLVQSKDTLPKFSNWAEDKAKRKYSSLEEMLEKTNTTSFVVMKDGKLLYENYSNGIKQGDRTQIFSVTKAFTTSILGIALQEGKIKNIDQPVSDFIPEFKEGELSKITLFHLIQMQSGLNYDEYKRVFQTLKYYNSKNSLKAQSSLKLKNEPGTVFKYKSIDNQLLGECIEIAVGEPFLDYAISKLFSKLEFQDPVAWSVDSREYGHIKYYGGLNISGRDLAKFGDLVLNDGVKNGEQILNPYTNSIYKDASCRNKDDKYCNGWWFNTWDDNYEVYFAAGFKGQIMMVNKKSGVTIVRLGENKGGLYWYDMLKNLSIQMGDKESNSSIKIDLAKK
jgi:CubicO group peptidase (beta-lactamase class C family)